MEKDIVHDLSHVNHKNDNTLTHIELSEADNESVIVRYSLYGKTYGTILHKDVVLKAILEISNKWLSKEAKIKRRDFNESYFGKPLHKPSEWLP